MTDASMPRSLTHRRKKEGYAAICAIGFDADPKAFCIHPTEDVEKLLPRLQIGTWHTLRFMRTIWTPGLPLARTIIGRVKVFLTDNGWGIGHDWFRAELDVLDDLIKAESIRMGAPTWSTSELAVWLQTLANREADRFAAGVI